MKQSSLLSVGITSIGYFIPPNILTSKTMAKTANLPLEVLTEKIGMQQKSVAIDEHPSTMGLKAARICLDKAKVNPIDIDVIAYCSAGHYDYRFWSPAASIQKQLGAINSFAFEVKNFCNGGNLGLHLCRNYLLADDNLSYALVIISDTLSRLINPIKPATPSLLMFADGAVAVLLKKGEKTNQLLNYSAITNGDFADALFIPLGGTKSPFQDSSDSDLNYIQVDNPEKLDKILSQVYLPNYVQVITSSLNKSGYHLNSLNFLLTNQVKLSLLHQILTACHLQEENTFISLKTQGHMGAVDSLFGLAKALENQQIKPGDLIVLASSAAGFSWAALTIKYND